MGGAYFHGVLIWRGGGGRVEGGGGKEEGGGRGRYLNHVPRCHTIHSTNTERYGIAPPPNL